MPAQTAPASVASTIARTMWAGPARPAHDEPTQTDDDRAHGPLALAADVEQAAAEGEGHGQAGQDQRGGEQQRLLEVEGRVRALVAAHPGEEPVEAGPVEDRLVGAQRVVAGRGDHHAADQEGQDRREDRRDGAAALRREPAANAAGLLVGGRIRRLGRWRGWGGGAHGASVSPRASPRRGPRGSRRRGTRRRSGPRRSRGCGPTATAPPRARARPAGSRGPRRARSTRRRWTYSIAPTSRPRVGWAATSTAGSRDISRAMMTFCWLPPDSDARGGRGPAAAHVELGEQRLGGRLDPPREHPAVARGGRLVEVVERDVLGQARSRAPARGAGGRWGCGRRPPSSAAPGLAPVMSWPSAVIVPEVGARRPVIASISSAWPLPSTPAMPTISPAAHLQRQAAHGLEAAVVVDDEVLHDQARLRRASPGALSIAQHDVAADHEPARGSPRSRPRWARSRCTCPAAAR